VDANGTHFHLLLGRYDWARCRVGETTLGTLWDKSGRHQEESVLAWDEERNELTLQPLLLKFTASPKDTRPSIDKRRGAGRDRYGNWYWIDESTSRIRVRSSGTGITSDFWPLIQETSPRIKRPGDFHEQEEVRHQSSTLKLSGLAVTEDHYLVVGVFEPKGLLIFDLHAVGEPRQLLWPEEVLFEPFDMAPRPCGGVWILDRRNHCFWALDRHFNVVGPKSETNTLTPESEDAFQPIDNSHGADNPRGAPRRVFPISAALNLASPLSAHDPISIDSLPDGTVLILDYDPTDLFRVSHFVDAASLCSKLKEGRDPLSDYLRSRFGASASQMLGEYRPPNEPDQRQLEVLADELNKMLNGPLLYEAERFKEIQLSEETIGLIKRNPAGEDLIRLNRILLEDAYPNEIERSREFSSIFRYDFQEKRQLDDPVSTGSMKAIIEEEHANAFRLVGYDIAFIREHEKDGASVRDRLYVAADDGNQAYAFNLCLRENKLQLKPVREFLPMRLFGGKGLVAAGNAVYYDFAESWVPLVKQLRPRYKSDATFLTPILDGKDPDCVWHRLMLDACIPPETLVIVHSRSANDRDDLLFTAWSPEPKFYLRGDGSELPFMSGVKNGPRSLADSKRGDGTWELLFQKARGRFLQLKIELSGNERSTPHLRALRAYYPRFSYLNHYLPSVYREDEQSASFLDHFLANVEGLYTSLEDKIAAVQMLFDVRSAPAEVLEWLASWFGVALDPAWDDTKRRLFIKHAMYFFQFRGTAHGLRMALHLALDPCADESIFSLPSAAQRKPHGIRIVEKFLTRITPGVIAGDPTEVGGQTVSSQANRWRPEQGRLVLIQRYTDFVNLTAKTKLTSVEYPIVPPTDAQQRARWQRFSLDLLGFEPGGSLLELTRWRSFLSSKRPDIDVSETPLPRDLPSVDTDRNYWTEFVLNANPSSIAAKRKLWQDFLARRYRRVNALNAAYGTHWASFESISLISELPANQAQLKDWYQFESVVLGMRRTAHKFSVLLPTPKSAAFNLGERQRHIDLAKRIVSLEKPAHTTFDVKFYWALFRIGEARLGEDTLLDVGSRAPQLIPNMILGQEYLGESYLSPHPPQDAGDRFILGRNQLGNRTFD
jgi:phage tail-like protein